MKPVVIGLTGQTGAGKTTVCKVFEEKGFGIINADLVSRKVVEKGSACLGELAAAFGNGILLPDGTLHRKKLGSIVFTHREKLTLLNSIIYPYITEEIKKEIAALAAEGREYILLDAPTLFESATDSLCQVIVAVTAEESLRLERIMRRDGISREMAKARMASQHSEEFFGNNSDFVISNSGDVIYLYKQAEKTVEKIINGGML